MRIAGGYGTPLPGSSQFALTTPIYVLELGANKIEGTKADFDAKYRDTIAEWLL